MRLATFNLESFGAEGDDAAPLDARIAVLRPALRRLGADILCLQEVNGQKVPGVGERRLAALAQLVAGTGYDRHELVHTTRDNGGAMDVHNLAILSRFPIRAHRQAMNTLVPAPQIRLVTADPPAEAPSPLAWDRPALIAEIELPDGRALHVLNAHLRAPLAAPVPGQKEAPFRWRSVSGWAEGYFLSTIKRAGQALEMRLLVEELFDADPAALLAVAGDLNAQDHETALRLLVAAEDDTGNGRLAPRMLVPVERSVAADRRHTVVHHGRPQTLDHILVSRTLLGHLAGVEVHNETLSDELLGATRIDRSPGSFHAPIVAEFDFE